MIELFSEYFSGQNSPHAKQLISALKKLSKDKDSDVRHFATYDLESLTSTSTELTSNLFTNSTFMQMTDVSIPRRIVLFVLCLYFLSSVKME